MYLRTLCVFAFLHFLGCSDTTSPSSDSVVAGENTAVTVDHTAHIDAVENGLLPPFLARGEPRPQWSIAERMAHYKVPGVSIAVIVDGKLAWAKGYGMLDAAGTKQVNTETLFQAASISKPVSSIGALRLVEQGRFSLDAPVNDHLASWKVPDNAYTARQPVTLRHLLSHRAGTTVHGFPGYARDAAVPSLVQVLTGQPPANTAAVVVDKTPGESYRYSGGGFTIMQLLVEDVTGERFATVMARQVLEPAGMTRSHFLHPIEDANAARAHAGDQSEPVIGHSHTYPELAAAGLWTTPSDLANLGLKVVSALQGEDRTFLSEEMARDMLTPLEDYGLGFGVVEVEDGLVFTHSGANHGFRARWYTYADGRGGAAIMTNADNGSPLIREISSAVGAIYGWAFDAASERDVVALSSESMQRIAGTYLLDPEDKESGIRISVADGALWIETPFFARSRLYPASDTTFFIADGFEFVLEQDASRQPTVLVIEGEVRATREPTE